MLPLERSVRIYVGIIEIKRDRADTIVIIDNLGHGCTLGVGDRIGLYLTIVNSITIGIGCSNDVAIRVNLFLNLNDTCTRDTLIVIVIDSRGEVASEVAIIPIILSICYVARRVIEDNLDRLVGVECAVAALHVMLKLTQDTDRALGVSTTLVIGVGAALRAIVNIEVYVGCIAITYLTDIEEVISNILLIITTAECRYRTIIELDLDMRTTCEVVVIVATGVCRIVSQVERLLILISIIVLKDGIGHLVGRDIGAIIECIIAESRNGVSYRGYEIWCSGGRTVLNFERSGDSYC